MFCGTSGRGQQESPESIIRESKAFRIGSQANVALVMRRMPAVDQVMTLNLDPLRAAATVRGIKPPDL
jgi:hypothetical protein